MARQGKNRLMTLRCDMAGKRSLEGKNLPQTEYGFHLHFLQRAYQLSVWRQADNP